MFHKILAYADDITIVFREKSEIKEVVKKVTKIAQIIKIKQETKHLN